MTLWQAAALGIIQGITEMLPISSSTHLMIFSKFQGLPNQRLSFDLFLNMGTVLAIIAFFWPQVFSLIKGSWDIVNGKKSENRDLFITVVVANIPLVILFGLAEALFDINFQSKFLISFSLIIFAVILWLCDRMASDNKKKTYVSRKDAIFTGIIQICAIIPGVSRLGISLSMLRYLKYPRQIAFEFSMVLSIFPVLGACFLKMLKIFTGSIVVENWTAISIGCVFSFLFGLISLFFAHSFLKKHSTLCFAVYRIIFGIFILIQK